MIDATAQLTPRRAELAGDLRRIGYLVGDLRAETRGGPRSYFEKDLALSRPAMLDRCAEMLKVLLPKDIDRVAAAGQAALALATAVALRSSLALLFLDGNGQVNGDVFPGARTVLLTDVLLSGATAQRELGVLTQRGLVPVAVLALLDRERGARALLETQGVPVRALFGESELLSAR